ncbi:uncharacterized protein LOC126553917 [Aphis gossypii]|uniref:uncharacterized protein LOC126553917 n=1 Tax=Aphis gossypii TaxID=80765 RepID=UPI002158CEFB|nr:uncharacterized protein LOC126553917 [Aphis gossypii]
MIWTTTAICQLYESEKNNDIMKNNEMGKGFFLMTNRLTQDALENMFLINRQKNGFNRNPTARTFRCSFSHSSYSLMQCSSTCNNCEADNDEYIINALKDVEVQKTTELVEVAYEKQPETTEFNSTSNSPSFISKRRVA